MEDWLKCQISPPLISAKPKGACCSMWIVQDVVAVHVHEVCKHEATAQYAHRISTLDN